MSDLGGDVSHDHFAGAVMSLSGDKKASPKIRLSCLRPWGLPQEGDPD